RRSPPTAATSPTWCLPSSTSGSWRNSRNRPDTRFDFVSAACVVVSADCVVVSADCVVVSASCGANTTTGAADTMGHDGAFGGSPVPGTLRSQWDTPDTAITANRA